MSGQKTIAVVGATGTQGGSVASAFLADPSWKVRAITRSASSSKAQALQAKGAEIFEANLNDAASVEKAFQGVHAVFSVTDYWTIYGDPTLQTKLKPGQAGNELAFELELQQGKNVFDAAAKIPSLERLIYSSLPNTKKLSKGKYTHALHFDSKALAAEYAQERYPELWAKTSIIQLGFYLTNFSQMPWLTPTKNDETGTYDFQIFHADSEYSMVAAETDGGILVKALIAAEPGKNLAAFRGRVTPVKFAELLGKILGIEARALEGGMKGAPPELQPHFEDTFNWSKDFGLFGEKVDTSLISPKDLDPSLKLGTVEDWIKEQDWSHIVKA